MSGSEPCVISVDHEPKSGENDQRYKKPAEVAGKGGRGFNGNTKTVTETQIRQCPDHAAHDSERQEESQPIAACSGQKIHSRTLKRQKRATKDHG